MPELYASSAHRWTQCHGSAHLVRDPGALPRVETDAAREGTCAAWVAETVINGDASCADDMLGKVHDNGWFVDQDMVDHVQPFIELVMSRHDPVAEKSVQCGPMRARIDAVSRDGDTLYIDDFKYGYGIVDVFENSQLLCNMAGYFEPGIPDWCRRVVLGIYQPRPSHPDGPYRTWTIEHGTLMQRLGDVRQAITRAANDTSLSPGRHCAGCRRAHDCAALTNTVYSMWDVIHGDGVIEVTGEALSAELTFLTRLSELLSARKSAVEADVEQRIKQNQFVPGWQMLDRVGKRQFNVDADTIMAMTGIDPTDKKLCTPAELERRGAKKKVVDMLTTIPNIGRKLAPVSEKSINKLFGEEDG